VVLEYAAFAVWCFAVALAGGLVGLVLGNLRLPLVLLLAASPASGACFDRFTRSTASASSLISVSLRSHSSLRLRAGSLSGASSST